VIVEAGAVLALGFFLGMRHATDADHVVAVTTIITRQRDILAAARVGLLWGLGHTLTVAAVGSAIILANVAIPHAVGVGMELSVGVMLVMLGAVNVAAYLNLTPASWLRAVAGTGHERRPTHDHGDRLAAIDRWANRSRLFDLTRPVVVGIVHGLAGSAAVALLVLAAVRDPYWAVAYLCVFGLGTMAGMMLITVGIASAFRFAGGRSEAASRRFGFACGLASIIFGLSFAYQTWSASAWSAEVLK